MSEIVDPHLERHLKEIERIAAQAGAIGCLLLSHAKLARLFYDIDNGPAYIDLNRLEYQDGHSEKVNLAAILLFPKAACRFREQEARWFTGGDETGPEEEGVAGDEYTP